MNEDRKEAIRAALATGAKTTEELMEAAGLVGNLALFQDIVREEVDAGRMHVIPGIFPTRWEARR
jgi:hypothetical protein